MALLGKKKKKEDKRQEASVSQDEVSEALENSGDVTDNNDSYTDDANGEKALLDQYTSGLNPAASSDDEKSANEDATVDATFEEPAEESDEDDVSDSLLDIFASEEEEDSDLSALTQGLEDVDIHSLLAEAKNVASRLRTLVESQKR